MSPLFLCSLSMALAGPPLPQPDEKADETWVVELVEKSRPNPRIGKEITYQALVRKAPGKAERTILFEQNQGGLKFLHRGDGTIVATLASPPQCMAFVPQSDRPIAIKSPNGSDLDLNRDWHHVHFVGDFLLYSLSYPNERRWTLGLLQLDVAKQEVAKHTILVETNHQKLNMATLGAPHHSIVKIGDYLFWTNHGLNEGSDDPKLQSDWGHRKLRVIDLKTHRFVTPADVDEKLADHRQHILNVLETKAHNTWPEFEIWAVGWLAKHHRTDEVLTKLKALASTIKEVQMEIKYGHFSTSVPAVTKAYQDALKGK